MSSLHPVAPPTPWGLWARWILSEDSAIAIPAHGQVVYRLVMNEPPKASDFKVTSLSRAAKADIPELFRVGLSHYVTPRQAEDNMWKPGQRVARVRLPPDRGIFVARTERMNPGHLEVWAPERVELRNFATVADKSL